MTTAWKIGRDIDRVAIDFALSLIAPFDMSRLASISVTRGAGGKHPHGRCYYPSKPHKRTAYSITCTLAGEFPHEWEIRGPYVKVPPEGLERPPGCEAGPYFSQGDDVQLQAFNRRVTLNLTDSTVFLIAHEVYHFLRHTKQIGGRNVEWQADQFGLMRVAEFRTGLAPIYSEWSEERARRV